MYAHFRRTPFVPWQLEQGTWLNHHSAAIRTGKAPASARTGGGSLYGGSLTVSLLAKPVKH
jgi:hypothetical protein